jgi:hypothetical protein
VDPTVKVIGPELSWKYQSGGDDDWFTPFVEECGAAADILSIHRYPFNAEQSTALNAMADGPSYRALLQRLRQTMDDGGLQDKPLAVTEANVTWDDEPGRPVLDAAPGTLAAAVWLADNLGISLEEDVFTTDYWSIREEWSLGMIDEDTPRPMYWALRLFGEHFGPERVAVGKTLSDISVYASRDSERRLTTAIVLNRDDVPHSITLDVEGLEEAPDPVVRDTPPLSITAIVFEDGEPSAQIWTYGAEEAAAQEGPTQLQ